MPLKVPAVWVESRKTPYGKKYRVVWREVLFDEHGKPFNGARHVEPFVSNSNLADKKKLDKVEELEARALGIKPKTQARTWQELADLYLDHSRKHKSQSTYNQFDKRAIDNFTAFAGDAQVQDITEQKINAWENHLMQEDEYGPTTVGIRLRCVRAALNYGKRMGWLDKTPIFHMPMAPEVGRAIPDQDLKAIIEASAPAVARAVKILVHTGMRLGEFCALTGEDIRESEEGVWEAHLRTLKRRHGETQRHRVVPLHPVVAAAVGLPPKPGPISGSLTRNALSSAYAKVVKRLKLPRTRIHDLRHTWATRFMEKTGDLYGLMRLGGWKDLKSVERYQHLTRGRSNAILSIDFGL